MSGRGIERVSAETTVLAPSPSAAEARAFVDRSSFVWHQRFELAPGVVTPGEHDLETLWSDSGLRERVRGRSLLDIGTANGGAAFQAERLGARRVVAVDIYPPDWFGFDALHRFLSSSVEYVQASVYDLGRSLGGERFDVVLFWGVLYHLRHPLLALDQVRAVLTENGEASIETAVADAELGERAPAARFYRREELGRDTSNWFAPTSACLEEWCASAGLEPEAVHTWGEGTGRRCIACVRRTPGAPEYTTISYEVPLRAEPADDAPPSAHDGAQRDAFAVGIDGETVDACPPGAEVVLRCAVENRGTAVLDGTMPNPVHLSYRTFRRDSGELVGDGPRARFPTPLPPGGRAELDFTFVAPEEPGRYRVRVTCVRELVAWFDDVDPSSAYAFDLEVRAPAAVARARGGPEAEPLPLPPLEMRILVGPTDPAAYENPSGDAIEPLVPAENYRAVLDFGCGCGRLARKLLQQRTPPARYLGIDLHPGMIRWCRENLMPRAPAFDFRHHDVAYAWNPGRGKPRVAAFPAEEGAFTLVLAHSVFTHLTEDQAAHYLRECRRVLTPDGVLFSTWFLFDKADFPMLDDGRNALYADHVDPNGAVLFAKEWLRERAREEGLAIYAVVPPEIRGFQWRVYLTPARPGVEDVPFPADEAEHGRQLAGLPPEDAASVGL